MHRIPSSILFHSFILDVRRDLICFDGEDVSDEVGCHGRCWYSFFFFSGATGMKVTSHYL